MGGVIAKGSAFAFLQSAGAGGAAATVITSTAGTTAARKAFSGLGKIAGAVREDMEEQEKLGQEEELSLLVLRERLRYVIFQNKVILDKTAF